MYFYKPLVLITRFYLLDVLNLPIMSYKIKYKVKFLM
jgi:hypothetical protein